MSDPSVPAVPRSSGGGPSPNVPRSTRTRSVHDAPALVWISKAPYRDIPTLIPFGAGGPELGSAKEVRPAGAGALEAPTAPLAHATQSAPHTDRPARDPSVTHAHRPRPG